MASVSIENTPWYKIRFDEMLKGLELRWTIGEKKKKAFQARRARVKQRQEFLQHRRIARLRMEGIIIDLEAVKRKCNAPREELMWYEQVSDEEEKRKVMRKRLKEMFKPKKRFNGIQERTESSCSDESTGKMTKGIEDAPQRCNVLRNYTKIYGVVQEKTKTVVEDKERHTSTIKDDGYIYKTTDSQSKPSTSLPKLNPTALANTNKPATPKTRTNGKPVVEKQVPEQKFQKAVTKVTTVNLMGDGLGRKSVSPSVQKIGGYKRPPRHSSDSSSSSPALPRINSGVSQK